MSTSNPSKPANGIGLGLDDVNFTRVPVPVDFSVCTLETLRYAKSLAEKSAAVVEVLHVVQPRNSRHESVVPGASLISTMIEGARQELKNWSSFCGRMKSGPPFPFVFVKAAPTRSFSARPAPPTPR